MGVLQELPLTGVSKFRVTLLTSFLDFCLHVFFLTYYSQDLRERILTDSDAGVPVEDLVEHYDISRSWTYALLKQRRETGSISPKNPRRGPTLKLAPYEQEVRQLVNDHPDATLEELHAMLPNKDEVTVVTLHNFLHRLKIPWKKRLSKQRNNIEKKLQKTLDIKRLVFIDEFGSKL